MCTEEYQAEINQTEDVFLDNMGGSKFRTHRLIFKLNTKKGSLTID